MRTRLAIFATITAALIATPALADSPSGHDASCGWRTDGVQFWSPAYTESTHYTGHDYYQGHYYRQFYDCHAPFYGSSLCSYFIHLSSVYCG